VYYFVVASDGQRYGPADIDTLVLWVGEGRVVASTTLIERGTDRQLRADAIDAVAAVLRRRPDTGGGRQQPGVVVERGPSEAPTLSRSPATPPPDPAAGVPPILFAPYTADGRRVGSKSKIVAGLLGILLPGLGLQRFYLGYIGTGILQILTIPCGVGIVWGFVEGVVCLCGGMQDADGYELHD